MRLKSGPHRAEDAAVGLGTALKYSMPSPPTLLAPELIPPDAVKENQRMSLVCVLRSFFVIYFHFFSLSIFFGAAPGKATGNAVGL